MWSFVFARISNDKVTNQKIPGIFWKKYVSTTPVWMFFSGKYEQLELKKNPPILGMGPGGIPMPQG